MLLLGHRGSPQTHLENTLNGFEHALERGLDGLETDAQPTWDGRFLIHHDPHLLDGRRIAALTLFEIQRDFPELPSLENLLEWAVTQPNFHLNLELKNDSNTHDGRESKLISALERLLPANGFLRGNLVISCFNPLSLWRMRSSGFKLGFLYHPKYLPAWLIELGWRLPLYSVHPHFSVVNQKLLERAEKRSLKVFTWTVNEKEDAERLARAGVNGMIGDYPQILLDAREKP